MTVAVKDPVSFAKEVREFGKRYGLRCPIPSTKKTLDNIYSLYVSPPDKVSYALRDAFIDLDDDFEKVKRMKAHYDKKGYHTFIQSSKADGGGNMTPELFSERGYFVVALFHEGVHRAKQKINYLIEEPVADIIGLNAAAQFFKEKKDRYGMRKVNCEMEDTAYTVGLFIRNYSRRIAELEKGRKIGCGESNNNAKLLSDRHYYLYHPMVSLAYEAIGDLKEAADFFLKLPPRLDACTQKLEKIITPNLRFARIRNFFKSHPTSSFGAR